MAPASQCRDLIEHVLNPTRGKVWKAEMTHWDDTMADRPEADDPAYVVGWTIPGLAVLVVLVTVWILGI
jgi:hypothetical protein